MTDRRPRDRLLLSREEGSPSVQTNLAEARDDDKCRSRRPCTSHPRPVQWHASHCRRHTLDHRGEHFDVPAKLAQAHDRSLQTTQAVDHAWEFKTHASHASHGLKSAPLDWGL